MSTTSSGWYPDPADELQQRYWDGAGWTHQTRAIPDSRQAPTSSTDPYPASAHPPAGDPPQTADAQHAEDRDTDPSHDVDATSRRGRTAALLGVGTVAVVALAASAWLWFNDSRQMPELRLEPVAVDDATEAWADAAGVQDAADDSADPSDGAAVAQDTEEPSTSDLLDPESAVPTPQTGQQEELVRVDFDGVCEAWLTPTELATQQIRPWEFPAQCPTAPVNLLGLDERWIVVVASLNGADFRYEEALSRAAGVDLHGQVLWSSHYPSLNPDLWVVYDGPFPTRAGASDAASRRGGASYPRVLSDDAGDRYCLDLVANCAGERRN